MEKINNLFKITPEVTDLWTCDITFFRMGIPTHCLCKENKRKKKKIQHNSAVFSAVADSENYSS